MRKIFLIFALIVLASSAFAADKQAYLGIFAETKVTKMAGMPAIPMNDKAMGKSSMFGGKPERNLEVRLWSPGIAPKDAFAYITPPEGLKQGDKLDLDLYRPTEEKGEVGKDGTGATGPDSNPDFTIKIYWGSSETVKQGQPKIIRWDKMSTGEKEQMRKQADKAQKAFSYFYKPDWTTGYWPTDKQSGKIAMDASLVGNYVLKTNYTGSCAIDAPSNVNFLDPIDIVSPKLDKTVPLDQFIPLKWKQIPNALGLHAMIFGMEGKNTFIIWSSSETYTDDMMATDWGYLQMAEVKKFVEATVMMSRSRTSANVPAGIFKDCDMVSLNMVGYGPGAALPEGQPLPRIQTKTSMMAMLGGKQFAGMGDMGSAAEEDSADNSTKGDESKDDSKATETKTQDTSSSSSDDSIGDTVKDEVNNGVKDAVKDGVRKIFRKH